MAVMALGKGAYAIHQSGKWYTDENIAQMLMERHLGKRPDGLQGRTIGEGKRRGRGRTMTGFGGDFRNL